MSIEDIVRQMQREAKERDKKKSALRRPHHRAIILTVPASDYATLKKRGSAIVTAVNDIVSTARCGASTFHHMERRLAMLYSATNGGFSKVYVRFNGECQHIHAEIIRILRAKIDASSFNVEVRVIPEA